MSETRRAAYIDALERLPTQQERIYAALLAHGAYGATCDELEVELGCQFTSAGAVLISLRDEGRARFAGFTRETRRGYKAEVHVVCDPPIEHPPFVRRGKGKWEMACRHAYSLLRNGGVEDALLELEAVLGKESAA